MVKVAVVDHIHIYTCFDGIFSSIAVVLGKAFVLAHLLNCAPVAYHKAFKAQLTAQNVGHNTLVSVGGNAVNIVEGGHHSRQGTVHCRAECGEIVVLQGVVGYLGVVVIPAALACAVAYEMLCAGEHRALLRQIIALKSANSRLGKAFTDKGVLAGTFDQPAPTVLATHIDHRCEGPLDTVVDGLLANGVVALLDQVEIEGCRHRQRNGEGDLVSVYDVSAKEKGNTRRGLLNGNLLQSVDGVDADVFLRFTASECRAA